MTEPVAGGGGQLIEKWAEYFRQYAWDEVGAFAQAYPRDRTRLEVDYQTLERYDPNLADDFVAQPEQIGDYARLALAELDLPVEHEFEDARIAIANLPRREQVHPGRTPQDAHATVKGIRGQVTRRSERGPRMIRAAFECQRCGTMTEIHQSIRGWHEPNQCEGCERQGPFEINFTESKMVDKQLLEVQIAPDEGDALSTDSTEVYLEDDLIDTVTPGDRVVIPSRIRYQQKGSAQNKKNDFEVYGVADSVEAVDGRMESMDIDEHRDVFETVANSTDPVGRAAESVAPGIKGYEKIKRALALLLFGGVNKEMKGDGGIRGDPHIALIGDPGLGKSMMLAYCAGLIPRSVYTTGQGSTTAGLTATAVKNDWGGEGWTLKAGALVEASGGVCAIDELDEMDENEEGALLEAMSQGQISVSKAGINATINAETRVLAAANPKYGRYDPYEAIGQQIDLEPAVMSRFDLIFTMLDEVDSDHDREVAQHILKRCRVGEMREAAQAVDEDWIEEVEPELDQEEMRAYIAHARDEYKPVMTDEADEIIEDGYMAIRTASEDGEDETIPITARKLEGMVRLAEASARIRLSETVEAYDAKQAVSIVRDSLQDVGIDPDTNEFDADMIEAGMSSSQRDMYKTIVAITGELDGQSEDFGAPREEIVEMTTENGYDHKDVEHAIDELKKRGELILRTKNPERLDVND